MAFFEQAITVLQTLVIALGAGLGIWGVINLLEGYGNDKLRTTYSYNIRQWTKSIAGTGRGTRIHRRP